MTEDQEPKVLIVKLSSLGDLFHALPTVRGLKRGLGAKIHWVTQQEYIPLVRCFTDVDHVIPFTRKVSFAGLKAFVNALREQEYAYVIDLQGLLKSAIVARMARGKIRIGPSFHRECSRLFYSSVAGRRNRNRHAVEQNLDVLHHLQIDTGDLEFSVSFPDKELAEKRPRVAMFPASRWSTKNWSTGCFVDVGRRLRRTRDVSVFVFGAPGDVHVCDEVVRGLDGEAVNLAGKTTLPDMGGLLKEMDLVIANDSGPVHLAAAVNTPALVIFGPTDPKRTGPYGKGHRVAMTSLSCQPCFSRRCRRRGIPCLRGVTPERVGEMALEMLVSCPRNSLA